MKTIFKKVFSKILYYSGAISLTRRLFPLKDVTVLMFHQVKPENFKEQIEYLRKYYNIISEQELIDWHYNNKKLPKNSVMLTFDDGYLNNYLYAWPILKKYKLPATIFLATGHINKQIMAWYDKVDYVINNANVKKIEFEGKSYNLDRKGKNKLTKKYYYYTITLPNKEREGLIEDLVNQSKIQMPKELPEEYSFLTWKQINEMKPLITFGAHTVNHPVLPNLTTEEKRFELMESKKIIKQNTKIDPASLCYPNGDYDKETIEIAKEAGYKIAFSSNFGRNTKNISPYLIQRIGANIEDTKEILATKLTSLINLFQRTKTKKHFKVVMITNYYYPQTGGITTAVDNMTQNLKKNNIKTAILAYPNYFRRIEILFKNSRRVHRFLVMLFLIQTTTYFLFNRIFYKKIVVHSHSANFCAFAGILAKPFGVKTVHTFHTDLRLNEIPEEVSEKVFLNKVDQLTAVSNFLGNSCIKHYKLSKKVKTIYNGAPLMNIKKMTKKDKKINVLYVGHLFEIKDPLLFVKGIEELSKEKDVSARIIGTGNLESDIKEYIKIRNIKNIELLGNLKYSQISKQYSWADVLVLTSKGEGMPIVLLEAMNSKTPVVSTIAGGTPELIENDITGVLLSERTPKAVAKGILKAIKNKEKYTKNAIEKLEKQFNWSKISLQYINIYRQLTSEKNYKSSEENEI